MEDNQNNFKYFIAVQGPFSVISFIGDIDRKAEKELQKCLNEVEISESSYFIFHYRDTGFFEQRAARLITQMHAIVRNKFKGHVINCGIRPALKEELLSKNIIREDEITTNVKKAIEILSRK